MSTQKSSSSKSTSFIFPGQGSQTVGMGSFLFENFITAQQTFEEASDALSINLKNLCFKSDEKTLALTENTQPALLTVCIATARVLKNDLGLKSISTAGHSVGEYSSLVLSNTLKFSDAVRAVRFRGQAMQNAVPVGDGGMTAVLGLDEDQVRFLCSWAEKNSGFKPVSPANYNCDGQIVISGNLKALNWLKENFKSDTIKLDSVKTDSAKKAKLISLQVSAPFHCKMMQPAEDRMREFLSEINFNHSEIPVIQNFTALAETGASTIKENLIRQISAPVLWTQSMINLKKMNHNTIVECGNGTVLKGLMKKIDAEFFQVFSTNSLDDLKALENL